MIGFDFGTNKCRIFPLRYSTNIKDTEISSPSIDTYFCFASDWDTMMSHEEALDFMMGILKRGVIPFCDAIHSRPFIDSQKRRVTRKVKINDEFIQLPDFSLLNSEKRTLFRREIKRRIGDLIENPLQTILQILEHARTKEGLI